MTNRLGEVRFLSRSPNLNRNILHYFGLIEVGVMLKKRLDIDLSI